MSYDYTPRAPTSKKTPLDGPDKSLLRKKLETLLPCERVSTTRRKLEMMGNGNRELASNAALKKSLADIRVCKSTGTMTILSPEMLVNVLDLIADGADHVALKPRSLAIGGAPKSKIIFAWLAGQ